MKKETYFTFIAFLICLFTLSSCKKEDVESIPETEEAKPTAGFTFKQVSPDDPFTFAFENTSTDFAEIRWEFGDDSTSSEISPTHTFANTGEYRVRMISRNGQGYWAQRETKINLIPDSMVSFSATAGTAGNVILRINPPLKADSIYWYKGTGSTAEFLNKGESATVTASGDVFEVYSVNIITPKGSTATVSALVSNWGVVNDVTDNAFLSVSRDNDGGKTAGEGSLKLVDNNSRSKFLQFNYVGDLWTQLDYGEKPAVVGAYTLTSADDAPERDPKDWQLEASNDGEAWDVLDTRTDEEFASRFLPRTFMIDNQKAYRYYRLNITANAGAGLIQIAEWRLLYVPK